MGRRDDVVAAATALVHEDGPAALTSVNVARALGVTQSAIYRHVRNMDELTALVVDTIVSDITGLLEQLIADPDLDWGAADVFPVISERLATMMTEHPRSFEVVDRWRFAPGPLGEGIRSTIDRGTDLLVAVLEGEWRADFGDQVLDTSIRAILRSHAQLVQDEVISIARLSRTGRLERDEVGRLMALRLLSGWYSLCVDINPTIGVPAPEVVWP